MHQRDCSEAVVARRHLVPGEEVEPHADDGHGEVQPLRRLWEARNKCRWRRMATGAMTACQRHRHCNHGSKPEICGQKIHPSHGFSPTAHVLQLEAKSKRAMLKPNDTHISILSPPPTPNPTKSLPHRGPNEWSSLTCMVHAAHDGPVFVAIFLISFWNFRDGATEGCFSLSHFYFGLQCKTLLRILYYVCRLLCIRSITMNEFLLAQLHQETLPYPSKHGVKI